MSFSNLKFIFPISMFIYICMYVCMYVCIYVSYIQELDNYLNIIFSQSNMHFYIYKYIRKIPFISKWGSNNDFWALFEHISLINDDIPGALNDWTIVWSEIEERVQ